MTDHHQKFNTFANVDRVWCYRYLINWQREGLHWHLYHKLLLATFWIRAMVSIDIFRCSTSKRDRDAEPNYLVLLWGMYFVFLFVEKAFVQKSLWRDLHMEANVYDCMIDLVFSNMFYNLYLPLVWPLIHHFRTCERRMMKELVL